MMILYSVIDSSADDGTGMIIRSGQGLEGVGTFTGDIKWDRLDPTDCVWIVPGTEFP